MIRCILGILIASFLTISPFNEYGWFMGCVHGLLAPYYWIISWFDPCLVKAPFHTTAYNIFWWIAFIESAIDILHSIMVWIIGLVALAFKRD